MSCSVTNMAWPMCSRPVTLGGGMASVKGAPGAAARQLFAKFAARLESWNVTKNGEPVPPTLEGVLAQDAAFVTAELAPLMSTTATTR